MSIVDLDLRLEKFTELEKETLVMLSNGFSIGDIARMQGVAHSTVASRTRKIYRKLAATNAANAVAIALRCGVIK